MSYATMSRIETISSTGFTDQESLSGNTIHEAYGRGNLPVDYDESTVPGHGFFSTLGSTCCERFHDIGEACHTSCCGKIKSFFMCITLPFYVLISPFFRARITRRKVTHHGIVYFYILMSCTIVINLWEQRNQYKYETLSYQFLQYFEATTMVLALIAMVIIACITRKKAIWNTQEKNLIFYFRTGLYVFGISSMVYSALSIYNYWYCNDGLNIFLYMAKFSFIVGQLLFLNYYYQAKLPSGGWVIQICLAHILATNLSLWIWTLCTEVFEPENTTIDENCLPIHLKHTEKYFYPLFVEYLLLVASMVYEIWMDLDLPADARRRLVGRDWIQERYGEEIEGLRENSGESHPIQLISSRRRRKFAPSLAFSFVLGLTFSSIFFAFILAANSAESQDSQFYHNFLICNICFYITQLIACYIIKVCSQSQPANRYYLFLIICRLLKTNNCLKCTGLISQTFRSCYKIYRPR